jgi:hypothetical protein
MIRQDEADWSFAEGHRLDEAEYAAHAEHLGSRCADAGVSLAPTRGSDTANSPQRDEATVRRSVR